MIATLPSVDTTAVASTSHLSKRFGDVTALDDVTLAIVPNRIHGLLGRNGAGKTTLMRLLTGQDFPTAGTISVFGHSPAENARVLQQLCFISEGQKYPEDFRPRHVFRNAPLFFDNWDQAFADDLITAFRLPVNRRIKKLSRGQLSALGVIVGLASRAPLTFFDEPYLGLDAVARQLFYDRLLDDFAEHPRTIILSTHLIDEVANLLERVIVIDDGRILVDEDAEELRGSATTLAGTASSIDAFTAGREVLHRQVLGSLAQVTVGRLTDDERRSAAAAGIDVSPVSLQQIVVALSGSAGTAGTAGSVGSAGFAGSAETGGTTGATGTTSTTDRMEEER